METLKVKFKKHWYNFIKQKFKLFFYFLIKVGDSIDITGPTGRLVYKGMGTSIITNFGEKPKKVNFKRLFLVGGGTGITPLY